jgi:hypothetical protein
MLEDKDLVCRDYFMTGMRCRNGTYVGRTVE